MSGLGACRAGRSADAVGAGRVEGGLEIGLDLGVVRGEDAMAGVRGLAVDGLAALRGRRRVGALAGRRRRRWILSASVRQSSPSAARPAPSVASLPGPAGGRPASAQSRLRIASAAMST